MGRDHERLWGGIVFPCDRHCGPLITHSVPHFRSASAYSPAALSGIPIGTSYLCGLTQVGGFEWQKDIQSVPTHHQPSTPHPSHISHPRTAAALPPVAAVEGPIVTPSPWGWALDWVWESPSSPSWHTSCTAYATSATWHRWVWGRSG